jgi:multidrug resistance efflux pump
VGEVTVSVGSQVKQGDLLAALDENDLPLDILQARMEKLNAEQALENLESSTALKREQLKADISNAQTSLVSLNNELSLLQDRVCTPGAAKPADRLRRRSNGLSDNPTELNLRASVCSKRAGLLRAGDHRASDCNTDR